MDSKPFAAGKPANSRAVDGKQAAEHKPDAKPTEHKPESKPAEPRSGGKPASKPTTKSSTPAKPKSSDDLFDNRH